VAHNETSSQTRAHIDLALPLTSGRRTTTLAPLGAEGVEKVNDYNGLRGDEKCEVSSVCDSEKVCDFNALGGRAPPGPTL
jgi:hypothetical protein